MEAKTNPFYELRNRLYATAAAGCSLIAEDFRLKRAIEAFQPMSEANKVFGKLYTMCNALLVSENRSADIIDCIALADALAVTQGTFADTSETVPEVKREYIKPTHMTFNELEAAKELLRKTVYSDQALDISLVKNIADPRLLSSVMSVAGRNGAGIAELLISLGAYLGEDIVPLLFDSLELSNPNATGNQICYIASVYRDKYNDRYVPLAEDENVPQGVRIAAIEAMAYCHDNEERLETIYNTSKGKVKNAALLALANMNSPAAEAPVKKMADNPKNTHFEFLCASGGEAATEYARKELKYILENGTKDKDPAHPFWLNVNSLLKSKKNVMDIFGMMAARREKDAITSEPRYGVSSTLNDPLIYDLYEKDDEDFRSMIKELYKKYPLTFFYSRFLLQLIEDPVDSIKKVGADHRKNDGTVTAVLNMLFTTPDGLYRIRRFNRFSEENYTNIRLFRSIPDDILRFISDPLEVYQIDNLMNLFPDGSMRQKVMDDMKSKCTMFSHLLKRCLPCDKEKIRAAAEKYVWAVARKFPCDEMISLLPEVTDKPLDGVVYNYGRMMYKYRSGRYWAYHVDPSIYPPETAVSDIKRLLKEFGGNTSNKGSDLNKDLTILINKYGIEV